MVEGEIGDRSGFDFRNLMRPGSGREVGIVEGEVLVEGHTTGRVLVDLFVPVVVGTLSVEPVSTSFVLLCVGPDEHSVILRVQDVGAGGIFDTEHRDQPVAIEVLGRIFVDPAVSVVVSGSIVGNSFGVWLLEEGFARIRRRTWDDVEGDPIEHLADGFVPRSLVSQPAGEPKGQLASHQVPRVNAADNKDRRFLVAFAGADLQQVNVPLAERFGQRPQRHERRCGDRIQLSAIGVVIGVAFQNRIADGSHYGHGRRDGTPGQQQEEAPARDRLFHAIHDSRWQWATLRRSSILFRRYHASMPVVERFRRLFAQSFMAGSPLRGMVNRKSLPSPTCDSIQILPSRRCTIFLQVARPIPVPGYFSSPCKRWKASKTFS